VVNIYNQASSLIFDVITHIHIVNTAATPATFDLHLGTTGVSTAASALFTAQPIAANGVYDWYGRLKMTSADYLTGQASAVTVSITVEGIQAVV
jgi:hypothetical protein